MRADLMVQAGRAMAPGFRYSVHLQRQEIPPSNFSYAARREGPTLRLTLSITPLDGGPVNLPPQ